MNIRRQRALLTAVVVAGSVVLYGCGGGDGGPDKTPFSQTDVDRAAAEAKKQAEMQADAVAKAKAAAEKAAADANRASDAADAAKKAADAAAAAATTGGLNLGEAEKRKDEAKAQSDMATAAYEAAKKAAEEAAAHAAGQSAADEYKKKAEASSVAAKTSAEMAAASAMGAMRSYETAKTLKGDRDATAIDAANAGSYAATAKLQAKAAAAAAKAAMDEVAKAKDAKTDKAAEDARTAATKARDDAKTASEAAADASKKANAIESDAPAVKTDKDKAAKQATAASDSLLMAEKYLDYTEGYADARLARTQADAGKKDLATHRDLMDRVRWIEKAMMADGKTPLTDDVLEDAAKRARNAAESLASATNTEVIQSYQGNVASALGMAKKAKSRAGEELEVAWKAYNAAKPFSENGMRIDDDNLASGATLRHPSGNLSLNKNDARIWAADQEITERGPHDTISQTTGVWSYGGIYTAAGTTAPIFAKYESQNYNIWASPQETKYQYAIYGIWTTSKDGTNLSMLSRSTKELTEINSFVFANTSDRTKNLPITGSATFTGNHNSYVSIVTGNKGTNGADSVMDFGSLSGDTITESGGGGKRYDGRVSGYTSVVADFAKGKVDLHLNNVQGITSTTYGKMFYDITEISLDGSTGELSGGTYVGLRSASGARTREPTNVRRSDPFRKNTTESFTPIVKLHGGVFGPKSNEIAGTIRLTASVPHGEASTSATAKDGSITVNTAFGVRNPCPVPTSFCK